MVLVKFSVTSQPTNNTVNWRSETVRRVSASDVTNSVPGLRGSVDVGCCVDHVGRDVKRRDDRQTERTDVIRRPRNAHSKRNVTHSLASTRVACIQNGTATVVVMPDTKMFLSVGICKKKNLKHATPRNNPPTHI